MAGGAWGIDPSYDDAFGERRSVSPTVRRAVREAMGVDPDESASDAVAVARPGARLATGGTLTLEDGTAMGTVERLPVDLPFGYHRLDLGDREQLLIVGPGRCHLPLPLRAWGWAVQLYATRSSASWGIGDLGDLRQLAEWSARLGAAYLVVSPVHAATPSPPQEASPYFPSSRRFRNPLYLQVTEVPGAESADLAELSERGRALNATRRIDRDAVVGLKMAALERIWERSARHGEDPELAAFRRREGEPLRQWATYATLVEQLGASWRRWPEEFRAPAVAAVRRFARRRAGRVAFHEWLQWLIDRQLGRAAAAGIGLVQDMPVGVDREGFDAWAWQELLALGASIGAPPDKFNLAGQDWSLPPFIPHRLRQTGYRPFIETLRASLRHAGGLRIDHAMGLFRLWWIPTGNAPHEGAYVRYRADELLEIVALESWRARALIVGEDLGTVEPQVRDELARRALLSYRLLYFEPRPVADYPELALAAVTTHDLPTIAGAWTRSDLADQARAGLEPDVAGLEHLRARLASATGCRPGTAVGEVIERTHAALASAPSVLVTATLEDALAVEERPNIPGTTDQRPNWCLALPRLLEELVEDPLVRRVDGALSRR